MGAECPKQYLSLAGMTILQHTLQRMALPEIAGMVIALADNDPYWESLQLDLPVPLHRVAGGKERCHSVFNALQFLQTHAQPEDWILVHDAARPCVRRADVYQLIQQLQTSSSGGLLATPVRDTLKRADAASVVTATVNREQLYHALTPQMFRFQVLQRALMLVLAEDGIVTDEAQAVEILGYPVQLVCGHADNLKITHPHDLGLAQLYLQQQAADDES